MHCMELVTRSELHTTRATLLSSYVRCLFSMHSFFLFFVFQFGETEVYEVLNVLEFTRYVLAHLVNYMSLEWQEWIFVYSLTELIPNEELVALMTDNPLFFTTRVHLLRTLLNALQTTWLHTPQTLHYILTLQTTWLDSLQIYRWSVALRPQNT